MKSKRKRKHYDDDFKINSVKAWRSSGKSAAAFAEEFDLPENNLYNWAKKFEGDGGVIISANENEELKRLRKENKDLRKEAEILKKAMGYFASPK